MITFETKEGRPERGPVFGDVADDQFFVDMGGSFCQKFDVLKYHIIADKNGAPNSDSRHNMSSDRPIKKILPHVTKINFPAE